MYPRVLRSAVLLVPLLLSSPVFAVPTDRADAAPARATFPPGDVRNLTAEESAELISGSPVFEARVRARWEAFEPEEQAMFIGEHPKWLPGMFLLGWNDLTAVEKREFVFWFPTFAKALQRCWNDWGLEERTAFARRHPDAIERIGVRRWSDDWWRPTLNPHAGHEWVGVPPGGGELALLRADRLERGEEAPSQTGEKRGR